MKSQLCSSAVPKQDTQDKESGRAYPGPHLPPFFVAVTISRFLAQAHMFLQLVESFHSHQDVMMKSRIKL